MLFLRLFPAILSILLVAAHLSRLNLHVFSILVLFIPFLLFIKKSWVMIFMQIALILASLEWLRSLFAYVDQYKKANQDWTRLAVIIGVVALFTLLSALMLRSKRIKKYYF